MNEPLSSPVTLLAVYCGLILLASLAGGWIPLFVRLTHTRLQVAISFVAGLMLGVGLLHLLPHAWHQLRSIDRAAGWLLGGFLVMFCVQRFFHFHHHDVPDESGELALAHPSQERGGPVAAPSHHPPPLAEHSARRLSWTGAMLGLTFHSLIDGVALAASVQAESHGLGHGGLLGVGTFLVVVLHKPFDAMAVGTLMARDGYSSRFRHLVNSLFGLVAPGGMGLFFLGARWEAGTAGHFLGAALAFCAGTFLCLSTSDLLPELQFHAHDRLKLSFALLAGLAIAVLVGRFEKSGHDWHQPSSLGSEAEILHATGKTWRPSPGSLATRTVR